MSADGRTPSAAEQDVGLLGEHLLDELRVLDENHGDARQRNRHHRSVGGEQASNQPLAGDQIAGTAGGGHQRAEGLIARGPGGGCPTGVGAVLLIFRPYGMAQRGRADETSL